MAVNKQNKNQGMTTVVVICVMAVFMALSLGLLLSASVLLSNAQKSAAKEQCRILAITFADEVKTELTSPTKDYENINEQMSADAANGSGTGLWHYIKDNIQDGSWTYYDDAGDSLHQMEKASRTFKMNSEGIPSQIAGTEITMFWEPSGNDNVPARLTIITSVTVKEQTCSIKDSYLLSTSAEADDYSSWKWSFDWRTQ